MSPHTTLLPEARVDVFATDAQTAAVARSLIQDWRFARVRVRVETGDITTAAERYASEKSPDLLIIETNQIDESFTRHLEALANVCATNTAAVFIGPENDISLYRRLLEMGATDYLVRPLQSEDLASIIGKTLLNRLGTSESRMISVMGCKGGVGTSRITQLLAHAFGQNGEQTTLFDCGGSWGLMGLTYGRDPMSHLRDLASAIRNQPDTMDDILHHVTPLVSWVAAGGDPLLNSTLTADSFEAITDHLMRKQPNIVLDLSQSSTGIRGLAFAKSQHIVLVTSATPIALRNARIMIKEIHQLRGIEAPLHLVVNTTGMLPKEELSLRDIQLTLGMTPVLDMRFQPDLFAALDTADPKDAITMLDSMSIAVNPLVRTITGKEMRRETPANTSPSASLLQRLLKRG